MGLVLKPSWMGLVNRTRMFLIVLKSTTILGTSQPNKGKVIIIGKRK